MTDVSENYCCHLLPVIVKYRLVGTELERMIVSDRTLIRSQCKYSHSFFHCSFLYSVLRNSI